MELGEFFGVFTAVCLALIVGNGFIAVLTLYIIKGTVEQIFKQERASLEKYIDSVENYKAAMQNTKENRPDADFTVPTKKRRNDN